MYYFLISYTGLVKNDNEITIEKTYDCTIYSTQIYPNRKELIQYIVDNSSVKLYADEIAIKSIVSLSEIEFQLWGGYSDEDIVKLKNDLLKE